MQIYLVKRKCSDGLSEYCEAIVFAYSHPKAKQAMINLVNRKRLKNRQQQCLGPYTAQDFKSTIIAKTGKSMFPPGILLSHLNI